MSLGLGEAIATLSCIDELAAVESPFEAWDRSVVHDGSPIWRSAAGSTGSRLMNAAQEHGVHDEAGEDYFVLLRVNGEIRYFAGKKGPSYGTADYEMGVIETPAAALSFGNEYLVDRRNLAEIRVQRKIVNASRFE